MNQRSKAPDEFKRRPNNRALRQASLLILLAVAGSFLFAALRSSPAAQQKPSGVPRLYHRSASVTVRGSGAIQTARNVGKAYYEQGKYMEAVSEFKKVTASGHALATDHLDLGLSLMQANNLDAALGELATAKQMDPELTNIDYALGILYKRELRDTDAEAALKRVTETDPNDPAAWFNLGTVYFSEAQHTADPETKSQKLQQALATHRHVVDMGFGHGQNFYVASLFHTFTILTRLRQPAEAQKILKVHEKVRDRVPNISLQSPALEGGRYGAILVPPAPAASVAQSAPVKLVFTDITSKLGIQANAPEARPQDPARQAASHFGPFVAVGDYDHDGHPDVYLASPAGRDQLFHGKPGGTFTDVTEKIHSEGGSFVTLSAVFADYDNSGHPSVFLAGVGGIRLYRNNGGTFRDETRKAGLEGKPGEVDTQAVLFDADDDGYLDLVVTAYGKWDSQKQTREFPGDLPGTTSHFYRNNGDGTFTDLTSSSGLASARGRMRGAVFADFNNDGYADLVFLRDDGPPLLYLNQGEDKLAERTSDAGPAFAQSRAFQAQVADFNHDGNFDLALWSADGYQVLLNRGGARFEAAEHLASIRPPSELFAFRGTVTDVDGDGFDDLLAADASGRLHFIANRRGRFEEVPLSLPGARHPLAVLTPAWLTDPGMLDLLALASDGQLRIFEKQGMPSRWLEVKFDGYKSNKGGAGTVVELKAGNFYKKVQAAGGPLRIFAGDLPKLDVVRVTWPNAIVQNSINVATNKSLDVRESERLASSCPFLYLWDGRHYRFFTDILGVAPLGEFLPDGTRLRPNPEELVKLGEAPRTRDGDYFFQITDEMREADYLDQLRLLAVDRPAAEEVYANEIYSSMPLSPALYAVRKKRSPAAAVDDRGNNVLALVHAVDGRYPTAFRRNRILGLAELHSLTLDLGSVSNAQPLALYLTGWVFWTDSNASRALSTSSQLQMVPPYLQVRDARGKWVTVISDMGLPSGTNRTMRLDLTRKFQSSNRHVRIVTKFCVYWDQIFFTADETRVASPDFIARPPDSSSARLPLANDSSEAQSRATDVSEMREGSNLTLFQLPLVSADLHYRGFSAVASDPEHLKPDSFEYAKVMADAPWNPVMRYYTRDG